MPQRVGIRFPPVTFLEVAEAVLRSAKRPLTAREITDIGLQRGLLRTSGKTPEATMSAALWGADGRADPSRVRARAAASSPRLGALGLRRPRALAAGVRPALSANHGERLRADFKDAPAADPDCRLTRPRRPPLGSRSARIANVTFRRTSPSYAATSVPRPRSTTSAKCYRPPAHEESS